MSIFDIFKKKAKYWESYKNFLITECRIPFNALLTLENRCDAVVNEIKNSGKRSVSVSDIDPDDRILLQMGIAAKVADNKYATTLLASDGKLIKELTDALSLWQPKDSNISVGSYIPSKKGKDVCIDLFGDTIPTCGAAIVVTNSDNFS